MWVVESARAASIFVSQRGLPLEDLAMGSSVSGPRTVARDVRRLQRQRLIPVGLREEWSRRRGTRVGDRSTHERPSIGHNLLFVMCCAHTAVRSLASWDLFYGWIRLVKDAYAAHTEGPATQRAPRTRPRRFF